MFSSNRLVARVLPRLLIVCSLIALFVALPTRPAQAATSGLLISEYLANPAGADSPFEYVELVATQTIDFTATPYSVIFSNNGTATVDGWIASGKITYGFNITTGNVNAGDIVYVGGSSMVPTAKLRTIDTANFSGDTLGLPEPTGVLGNGGLNADGIGVFAADISLVTSATVPVDAIFFGTGVGTAAVASGTAGYELPVNDHYAGGKLQTNSFLAPDPGSTIVTSASGVYDPISGTFTTPRSWTTSTTIDESNSSVIVTGVSIATACPATLVTDVGAAASASVSAVDPDGILSAPQITSTPVAGITLTGATAAAAVGGTASATLSVADSTAAGVYPVVISFSNNNTPTQLARCTVQVSVVPEGVEALIRDIQGAAHVSPFNNQAVALVPGIVTATRSNGFYFQDPNPDTDIATSEAIFVFTSTAPSVSVGDAVTVSGTVGEFRPGGTATNLTITQITTPTIGVASTGNPLPATTVIGTGGRVPPSAVINDDGSGDVESGGTFDAATDGIDFYESLEAMRVQVNDAVVVGPTNSFGEIYVVGDGGTNASVRTTRGGIVIGQNDFNPERIQIDDTITNGEPNVNVGDTFPGAIIGVISYDFGSYELLNTQSLPAPTSSSLTQEQTATPDADELAVATFNVENLDSNDSDGKFSELAELIVTNLQAPDLLALEEVQDNNGPTNDGVVDASETYNRLIAAIATAGGPTYQFRQINPENNQDGGEPGGNIRVGFLFRTDRGLSFVDRPGGTATSATTAINAATGVQLSASPGRVDPTNTAFTSSRKPLAGEFTYNGETLFVVANHFNSKGGDQPLFGRNQPPALTTEAQRIQQAEAVRLFVQGILDLDAEANVIVLGDLNDFEFSQPLLTLKQAGLTPLVETLPQSERYTYVFEGNSQALDHILVSQGLKNGTAIDYDIVHANAEFATQASDHDPQIARFDFSPSSTIYLPIVIKQ